MGSRGESVSRWRHHDKREARRATYSMGEFVVFSVYVQFWGFCFYGFYVVVVYLQWRLTIANDVDKSNRGLAKRTVIFIASRFQNKLPVFQSMTLCDFTSYLFYSKTSFDELKNSKINDVNSSDQVEQSPSLGSIARLKFC